MAVTRGREREGSVRYLESFLDLGWPVGMADEPEVPWVEQEAFVQDFGVECLDKLGV